MSGQPSGPVALTFVGLGDDPLSLRDVEEMLAERGVDVSYETVRRWFLKFGPGIAANLRRTRPKPSDYWQLDGMAVSINGKRYWLWRAVDDVDVAARNDTAKARIQSRRTG